MIRLPEAQWNTGDCSDQAVRWLRLGGRTYLEIKGSDVDEPSSERGEYHFVSTVDQGDANRVCNAGFLRPSPVLNARWDGKGWKAAGR